MPTIDTSLLPSPINVEKLALPNGVVMAPLTRGRSGTKGGPPPFAADYHAQRASAGLIVSAATNISTQARGYEYAPGIWSDAQVTSWRNVTGTVRDAGGVIVLQL